MKKILLYIFIFLCIHLGGKSQITLVCNETFKQTPTNWNINPAYSWISDSQLYVSGQKSFIGLVPATDNDSVLLTTPFFDLSSYAHVVLKFKHICKVNKNDVCEIEYRENHMVSQWKTLPISSYQGNGRYINHRFNDSSYNTWQANNLMAIPNNSWWQEEVFDLSDQASYTQVQFRFKIKKGNVSGTYFANGWSIDDFQIFASNNPIISPIVTFITTYSDTVFNTGPFPITAFVQSRSGTPLLPPVLHYTSTYNHTYTHDSVSMNRISGDTIWQATIPQHVFGSKLVYKIIASDSAQNTANIQADFYIKRLPPYDSNSVAITQLNTPDSVVLYNQTIAVYVDIQNKGLKNLQSTTLHWSVNGNIQTPVYWTGNLPDGFNEQVLLGNYISGIYGSYDTLIVWTDLPNGQHDPNTSDDTLKRYIYNCRMLFQGDYIIGNSSFADFSSINGALNALKNADCIRGNIQLKIENGIYAENIDLSNFSNYLNNYSLRITSLANHRDSVVLTVSSGVLININNTHNLSIDNLTLNVANSGFYAVQFTGNARNVTINTCNIFANPIATTEHFAGIYASDNHTWTIDNIHIINNYIHGGYSNIHITAGSSSNYGTILRIDSNTCAHAYWIGIHLSNALAVSLSNNIISSQPNYTSGDYNALSLRQSSIGNIVANKVKINGYSDRLYVFYLNEINKNTATPTLIANNEIIAISNGTSSYAIYASNSKINLYHNSIFIKKHTAGGTALHLASTTAAIKNNLIVCDTGLTPIQSTFSILTSNYNNLYSPDFSLPAWQQYIGQDTHSVSLYPTFINPAIHLELSDYNLLSCPRLQEVPHDITHLTRTSTTTMGAYAVILKNGYNLTAVAVVSPVSDMGNTCHAAHQSPIQVAIRNSGTDTLRFNTHPMKLTAEIKGVYTFQIDTIIHTGLLLPGAIDTFTITNHLNTSQNGIYYITVYLECAADSISTDDTVQSTYRVSNILLPYDVDFSTFPPELIIQSVAGDVNWTIDTQIGTFPVISPVYGKGRLQFKGSVGTGSVSQAIWSGIDLSQSSNPRLGYWYAHDNSFSRDLTLVKISTDNGQTSTTLTSLRLFDANISAPEWRYYEINLSPYVNESCVSIIFEASALGGGDQSLDRIRLFGYTDLELSLLLPDFNDFTDCDFPNNNIQVVLKNLTHQNIALDTTNIHLSVKGDDSTNYTYKIPNNRILAGSSSDTLVITSNFPFTFGKTYHFIAYINSVDSNTLNDTIRMTYSIKPDISIDTVVGMDMPHCKKVGDSVYLTAFVRNTGNVPISNIPLSVAVNKNPTLKDTIWQTLQPNDTISLSFSNCFTVPSVSHIQPYYSVSVKHHYPCDIESNNDEVYFFACVDLDAVVDVAITSILKPIENICDSGKSLVYPKITLSNKGNTDLYNVQLHILVDSNNVTTYHLHDSIENLPAHTTLDIEFSTPYSVPNMSSTSDLYQLTVYIDKQDGDLSSQDDTLSLNACAIYNTTSISNTHTDKWKVYQNIPNPASHTSIIPYYIPENGVIHFQLISINGQQLIDKEIYSPSGNQQLYIDLSAITEGLYYYRLTYKDMEITRKMIVVKEER